MRRLCGAIKPCTGRKTLTTSGNNLPHPPTHFEHAPALLLDVDGTLLNIAETPDAVRAEHELRDVLNRLVPALNGAIAFVSGRPISDLDRIFSPLQIASAGLHGIERRNASGSLHHTSFNNPLADIRERLASFASSIDGVLLEDKGAAIALHYRRAPDVKDRAGDLVRELTKNRDDLSLLDGKMVFEIKPHGVNKGTAVEAFMAEPPFHGRMPIFVGDDTTDEDGFAAVNTLSGLSIRVGPAPETHACFHIPSVDDVIVWLENVADTLSKGSSTV